MTPGPTIETERLRLRPWRDTDLDAYVTICGDPAVMRWLGARGAPLTPEEAAGQLEGFRQRWAEDGFGLWCAASLATDECLGFIGFAEPRFLPEILPCIEIGWRLARPAWGQGLATEGARRAMDFGFATLGLERIVSVTRPENRSSWNVMQKLGMTVERTTIHPEHGFDVVVYEKLAP